MADNQSFDITTGCDLQEVDNAVNQAQKELSQRYDFKNVKFTLELKRPEKELLMTAPDDSKLRAIWDVVQSKMVKRGVPLQNLKQEPAQPAGGNTLRQQVKLKQGIDTDTAKKIVKFVKDAKLKKVQASILQEQVRVTSPSRDDLQQMMGLLRTQDFGVELQFGNFR